MPLPTYEQFDLNPNGRMFWERLNEGSPYILELGTKRSKPNHPTHHKDLAPNATWVLSDFEDGIDVDVLADIHDLPFPNSTFDAIVCVSVFEHIKYPWIASQEFWRVLKPGGHALVVTHQSFPLHGYPQDYWRFSTETFTEVLFADPWTSVSWYEYPAKLIPPPEIEVWDPSAEVFLNVACVARRP